MCSKYEGKCLTAKTFLNGYAGRKKLAFPVYETRQEDRLYYSVATLEGKKNSTLLWNHGKKHAEGGTGCSIGVFASHGFS